MELGKAQQVLTTLLQRQRLPQVVLFYGREGIPTDDLLDSLLRQLLCQHGNTCGARKQQGVRKASDICVSCHALDHDNHDDVLCFDAEQESFGVAEVSHLQSFLPLLGSSRVAIVRAAHLISRQAANKLLKTLEEPPPSAYIFLTSTRYRQLLPTITSRCFHLLLKEQGEPPSSSFMAQFEQLLAAKQWSQRQLLLKKLREGKCSLQEFLFFYEQHLNRTYRVVLGDGKKQAHATAVRRTRLHNIKQLLQQQISLNTQLGIESLLASSEQGAAP